MRPLKRPKAYKLKTVATLLILLFLASCAAAETSPIISNVYISGNERIETAVLIKAVTATLPGKPLDTKALQADLDRLIATGHLQEAKARVVPMGSSVAVFIHVKELDQEVKEVTVEGAKVDSKNGVLKKGDYITTEGVQKEAARINESLAKKGSLAEVSKVSVDKAGAVKFVVEEKKISEIRFTGLKKTKEWVAQKIVRPLKPGMVPTRADLEKALARLHESGYFSEATVRMVPAEKVGEYILQFDVKEGDTGEWRIGGGHNSRSGAILVGAIKENNIGGEGKSISANFKYNPDDSAYSINYRDNYLKKSDNAFGASIWKTSYTGTIDNKTYSERLSGASIVFERSLHDDPRFKFTTGFRAETQKVTQNGVLQNSTLRIISFGILRDKTDDFKNPTSGHSIQARLDTAIKALGGNTSFSKLTASIQQYLPLNEKSLVAFRLGAQVGMGTLPTHEQFAVGGETAVRGVPEGNLRGESGVVATAEYRQTISKDLQGVAFVDIGKSSGLSESGAAVGAGIGIRLKTAMGVIRMDAAKSGRNPWQLIFGIGSTF